MHHNNIHFLATFITAGLLWGAVGSARAEVYYEYVPVLEVTPIIESRRVPLRERICSHQETDGNGSPTGAGDVRQGRPRLSISEAAREDRRLWAELAAPRERCRIAERYTERQEVAGYRVEYAYGSERLVTRMDHDPGEP